MYIMTAVPQTIHKMRQMRAEWVSLPEKHPKIFTEETVESFEYARSYFAKYTERQEYELAIRAIDIGCVDALAEEIKAIFPDVKKKLSWWQIGKYISLAAIILMIFNR